jgi:hypothetical protein
VSRFELARSVKCGSRFSLCLRDYQVQVWGAVNERLGFFSSAWTPSRSWPWVGEVDLERLDSDLAPSSGLYSSDWATDSDEDFWDSESESELCLGLTGFLLAAALVFGGILLFYEKLYN